MLSAARLQWDALTKRERDLLSTAQAGYSGDWFVNGRTAPVARLVRRGLALSAMATAARLTPAGVVVRQVGIATLVEVPDAP